MKYIFKNLKKYLLPILLIVVFLVVQAALDLTLPGYTSKIINVGIQQNGIENTIPEALTEDTFKKLAFFMDVNILNDNFKLIDKTDKVNFDKYIKKYPALKNGNIYLLDKQDDNLKEQMMEAMILVSFYTKPSDNLTKIKKELISHFPPESSINEDTDIFIILKLLPENQLQELNSKILETTSNFPQMMTDQIAINFVKNEYVKLGKDINQIQTNYIITTGAIMIGITVLSMIAISVVNLFSSRVASGLGRDLRNDVFSKVMRFSSAEFKKFQTSSLITRSTNDIMQIQNLTVMLFRIMIYAPIIGIGAVLKVLSTDVSMGWILVLAIGAIIFVMIIMFILVLPKFKISQKLLDRLNLVSREVLTGLPVIRAFSTERYEEKKFDEANKDLKKVNLFINISGSVLFPIMMFLMNTIILLIVWVSAKGIDDGLIQVGDMMAFMQYTIQIIMAFLMISMVSMMIPRALVSVSRIKEVLDTPLSIKDPDKELEFNKNKQGEVEFVDVSFQYPDADTPVVSGISFLAKAGETTAIIGSTGSGKSTIVNLIPRFFDVTTGKILVSGVDIRKINQKILRKQIGYVPQKGILFSGTVESNVKYGNAKLTKNEVYNALKIAQAKDFVEKMTEQEKTHIAQGGTNVSGGQKQRLSIARAVAINPSVYIFDDSFSALDMKTDQNLRAALGKYTKEATVIIVAQRVSTVINAEQIIVMDKGKIISKGTHKELLKKCSVYREIAESQLSKEELENV